MYSYHYTIINYYTVQQSVFIAFNLAKSLRISAIMAGDMLTSIGHRYMLSVPASLSGFCTLSIKSCITHKQSSNLSNGACALRWAIQGGSDY